MTTKKNHSTRRAPESRAERDQGLTDWARKVKRRGWGKIDRELGESFAPRLKDEQDLRWYFERGAAGDRDGTPEMLKRWRRIDRCLDGFGYALMLHYSRNQAPTTSSELRELTSEYRQYLRNTVKSYGPANWEPHCVVPEGKLRSLVRVVRPVHETVRRTSRHGERTYLAQRPVDEEPGLGLLIRDIPMSTWGGRRLSLEHVRLLLEMACAVPYVDARAMAAVDAIKMIETKLATVPAAIPWHQLQGEEREEAVKRELRAEGRAEAKPTRREEIAEDLERIRAETHDIAELHEEDKSGMVAWTGTHGQALAPGTWDPRKIEVNNGRPITTVSEISGRLKLGTKWTRAALLDLQCPGIQTKTSAIPVEWFKSDKGREFWKRAESQQGRQILAKDAAARLLRGGRCR